jgi:hypothetical protein
MLVAFPLPVLTPFPVPPVSVEVAVPVLDQKALAVAMLEQVTLLLCLLQRKCLQRKNIRLKY